jgi:ABC-type branched-subunit amino acid transport system ATPase component
VIACALLSHGRLLLLEDLPEGGLHTATVEDVRDALSRITQGVAEVIPAGSTC